MQEKPTYKENENLLEDAIEDTRTQLSELIILDHGVISIFQLIVTFLDTCTLNTRLYLKALMSVSDLCDFESLRNYLVTNGMCEALGTALHVRSNTSDTSLFEEYYCNFRYLELLDKVKGNEDIWSHCRRILLW